MNSLSKKEIRRYITDRKNAMTEEEAALKSLCIQGLLLESREYAEAENIFVYVSYNREVITDGIIQESLKDGKSVYVPRINNENVMEFYRIFSMKDDLKPGRFGILEPVGCCLDDSRKGLMIMPGLAFDRDFHRIGYGGGYYDRYLERENCLVKVALAFEFQIIDEVPHDEFDISPDMIITEKHILRK